MWQTVGFEKIKQSFMKLHKGGLLRHAYLFSGQDMIGKRTFAFELARKINYSAPGNFKNHPDIFFALPSDNEIISIDKIREIKKFARLKCHTGPYKIVIIDNAHAITPEAGNSMLKIIEEPFPNTIFILISSNPGRILPTVLSRCENFKFPPHRSEILRRYFGNLGLKDDQVEFLIKFSNGKIGLAINLHKNKSFYLIKDIIKDFHNLIRYPLYKKFKFTSELLEGKLKYNARTAIMFWMLYLRSPFSQKLKISKSETLQKLSKLYYHLEQPQLNHKLLFESELLDI